MSRRTGRDSSLNESAVTAIRAGDVLTMGAAGDITDGAVAFSEADGLIRAVGDYASVHAAFAGAVAAGDGADIVMPGFINAHDHLSEGLISGIGETMNLHEWQERLIRPVVPHLTFTACSQSPDAATGRPRPREGHTMTAEEPGLTWPASNRPVQLVDCLQPWNADMPPFPADKPSIVAWAKRLPSHGTNRERISTQLHIGTHIDTPLRRRDRAQPRHDGRRSARGGCQGRAGHLYTAALIASRFLIETRVSRLPAVPASPRRSARNRAAAHSGRGASMRAMSAARPRWRREITWQNGRAAYREIPDAGIAGRAKVDGYRSA